MRYLLFDPFHGAAGDMVTASLLSLGADQELVRKAMRSVVSDPTLSNVQRGGIQALHIMTHAKETPRTFDEVVGRIREANAPAVAIERAIRVFKRISDAEEAVHGRGSHFHEVGADDAIADIIGACTAMHSLCPDGVAVRPVAVGGGTVKGAHGVLPVPAPATLAILRQSNLTILPGSPGQGELCTPTGAALLAEFSTMSPEDIRPGVVRGIGYGAGTKDTSDSPNVLRAVLIEAADDLSNDYVDILETNVDDVSGEVIGNAISVLMGAGARDASAIPCIMKKGRAGYLIRVICPEEDSGRLARVMAEELGTLGIRCSPSVHRFIADRSVEMINVEIAGYKKVVPVKCGWIGERCYTVKAEFENVRELAAESGIPAREIARIIEARARRELAEQPAGEHDGTRKSGKRKP